MALVLYLYSMIYSAVIHFQYKSIDIYILYTCLCTFWKSLSLSHAWTTNWPEVKPELWQVVLASLFPSWTLEVLLASTVQSDPDLAGWRPTRRSPAMSSMSRLGLVVRNFIFPPEVLLKNKPSQVFYGTFFRIQDSTHWDRLSRVVR